MADLNYVQHESSNVHSTAYDPDARKLYVRFHNGGHYVYSDVAKHHHEAMQATDSVGSYLHSQIKGQHACERLDQ